VDRLLGVLLGAGPARGFGVDGDDLGGRFDQRRNPGDETAAEGLGVERGEDVAEMIVRRRSVGERPEARRRVSFFSPKRAMSVKASAPANTASRHKSKISSRG